MATPEERDADERGQLVHQLLLEGRAAGFLRRRARVPATTTPNSTLSEQDQPDRYQNSVPGSLPAWWRFRRSAGGT